MRARAIRLRMTARKVLRRGGSTGQCPPGAGEADAAGGQPHQDQADQSGPHADDPPVLDRARAARPARRPRRRRACPTSGSACRPRRSGSRRARTPRPPRASSPRTAATGRARGSITAGSSVNARGSTSASASRTIANASPTATDQRDHPPCRRARALRVARAEHPAHHHLRRDRQRVEHEREEDPQLERDLVGGERRRADAGEHRRGDQEGAEQRGRAHGDVRADPDQRPDALPPRPLPARRAAARPRTRRPCPPARSPCPTPSPARPQSNP